VLFRSRTGAAARERGDKAWVSKKSRRFLPILCRIIPVSRTENPVIYRILITPHIFVNIAAMHMNPLKIDAARLPLPFARSYTAFRTASAAPRVPLPPVRPSRWPARPFTPSIASLRVVWRNQNTVWSTDWCVVLSHNAVSLGLARSGVVVRAVQHLGSGTVC